jgi:hypothetical protein
LLGIIKIAGWASDQDGEEVKAGGTGNWLPVLRNNKRVKFGVNNHPDIEL